MVGSHVALNVGVVAVAAALGALVRWGMGLVFNPLFPTLPLGTLFANLVGGFLMGVVMALTKESAFFPETVRLGITTGFLGALTTFSTFSAETVNLLSSAQYGWTALIIAAHVVGSLVMTVAGIYVTRWMIV